MEELAKKTRQYLECNYKELNLHCVRRFPDGSCETSSLLLGKILKDIFPEKQVLFVKGTNSQKYEMHFWVEVGDQIFDITADQFEGITEPLFGEPSDIITRRFDDLEKMSISEALTTNNFATTRQTEFEFISKEVRLET